MLYQRTKKCFAFFRKESVLCLSVLLALLSCLFVPSGAAYFSYIDWETLAQLFSLMAVMKGLQEANFFVSMAGLLLKRIKSTRTMLFALVFLPFVCSMVITNDVALIVFVPFGLTILRMAGQECLAVPQVALQTVAANLGSMLTPMGNPQNLYLYNRSGMGFGEFCRLLFPYFLASAVCLAAAILLIKPTHISAISVSAKTGGRRKLFFYSAGFLLCLAGVFNLLSPVVIAPVVAAALLVFERGLLRAVDYSLLGTFFAFFIFVGNIVQIEGIRNFLASALEGRVELAAVLTSQVISNVPAALLLSGFTSRWEDLIIGCNFGGLGTLIASMASLISYKALIKDFPGQKRRYLGHFTLLNITFLMLLFLLEAAL